MSSFQSVVIMSRPFAVYIRDYHQFKNKNITSAIKRWPAIALFQEGVSLLR